VKSILLEQGLENDGKDSVPIFEVRMTSTLAQVIQKIVATRVHRLWAVDEQKALIGCISVTDIIRVCLEKAEE
jgi:Mg/Co/Ni transporter MgtE